jgi:uncharacterized hydrophobic protein (TIGR00271 family)
MSTTGNESAIFSAGSIPSTHTIVSSRHVESGMPLEQQRLRLQDVASMLRTSNRFAEVTLEEIERVRNIHETFREGSQFSFNYNTLLIVASILAGLGLVSNSSATIIASMLVSPIMGPVVGMAYAATIQDWRLFRDAARTEFLSLIFCIVSGAAIGSCTGWTHLAEDWPTQEMETRGTWQNFMVALPVAFFSGLGVAVSVLDQQTSSLVGVAISASLLPPAVNAGVLWVAFLYYEKGRLPELHDTSYERSDFRIGGSVSLALTLANIVLIIGSSMLMFRMKEVRSYGSNGRVSLLAHPRRILTD